MQCPYCLGENSEGYKFCRNCGKPRPVQAQPPGVGQPVPPTVSVPGIQPPQQAGGGWGGGQPGAPYQPGEAFSTVQMADPFRPSEETMPGLTPPVMPPQSAYPGYGPAPVPGYSQAAAPPATRGVRRPGLIAGLLIGIVLFVLLLAAGAYWLLGSGGMYSSALAPIFGGKFLAIGMPQEEDRITLYLVEQGQSAEDGVLLAEKIKLADASFLVRSADRADILLSKTENNYGGFVPRSKNLLFWYLYDGKILLDQIATGNNEPDAILDATSENLVGLVVNSGKKVILIEELADETRCYVSESGGSADELGKGSGCLVSGDGSTVLLSTTQDGKVTLTAITADDNKDETEIVENQEGVSEARISWDGSRTAYVQAENDKTRVVLVDSKNGDKLSEGDESTKITGLAFAPRSNAFGYIADLGDGNFQLSILDDDEAKEVVSSKNLRAWFSRDGKYLIYLEGDDAGDLSLSSYNVKDDEQEKIASGTNLAYSVLQYPERVLVKEQDGADLTISSAKVDGLDTLNLYNESDRELVDVWSVPGEEALFVLLKNTDGLQSIYVTPLDKDEGYFLIEDWAEVQLFNRAPNQKEVVFVGRKEVADPLTLFSIPLEDGADPVELDDKLEGVVNAVYSKDNKFIYYTALTGPNLGDVEVRKVDSQGDENPDAEYDKAFLVDTQWGAVEPFMPVAWISIGEVATTEEPELEESVTPQCAKTVDLALGADLQDNIAIDQRNCYRIQVNAGQAYSFIVENLSELDLVLSVKDANGVELAADDDSGPGANPLINLTPALAGPLIVELLDKNNQAGDYRIRAQEGTSDSTLNNAQPLLPGVKERGTITGASLVFIQPIDYSTHGVLYSVSGTAGQQITIDVFANSLGSEVIPELILYDGNYNVIKEDQVIITGNQDYTFLFTLPVDGQYFILVKDDTDRYGSADKFFFEILLRN